MGNEGEACATEGEEIVDGDEERDAGTEVPFACRDDNNDTDDNAVEVSLLDGMRDRWVVSLMLESWPEFKGGVAGGEQVAIIEDSELAAGVGALVEGSSRAMSVLCRKMLSGD